jgi:hypothetical protein
MPVLGVGCGFFLLPYAALLGLIASGNILGEFKTLFFAAINVFIGNLLDTLHISPVQLRNLHLGHVFLR